MKKILYLSPTNITERSGVGIACLAFYNALKEIYPGKVDLAMTEESCIGEYANAIKIPPRNRIKAILSGCIHRYKSFMIPFLKKHHTEYSLCIINGSVYAGDMMSVFERYNIKVIIIHHNYEREYYMDNKSIGTFHGHFAGFIVHNEKNAYRRADLNLFLTQPDLSLISNAYGKTKGENAIIGVFDPERIDYLLSKKVEKNLVAITGGLRLFQAYKSIEIFENHYYPLLREKFPDLRIVIAGRAPHQIVIDFCKKYPKIIELIPSPPDMDPIIDRASIFLCPTCYGGGLKLHVMDGLRKGLPVLTHKVSARGYEVFLGKPYFQVYENPKEFIEGLNKIVKYISENSNYQQEILDTYIQNFGYEAGVNKMRKALSLLSIE